MVSPRKKSSDMKRSSGFTPAPSRSLRGRLLASVASGRSDISIVRIVVAIAVVLRFRVWLQLSWLVPGNSVTGSTRGANLSQAIWRLTPNFFEHTQLHAGISIESVNTQASDLFRAEGGRRPGKPDLTPSRVRSLGACKYALLFARPPDHACTIISAATVEEPEPCPSVPPCTRRPSPCARASATA